jgi:hypothetical protein
MSVNATFNGNSLQTSNIITGEIDKDSSPDITMNILALAKAPRSSVTSALKQQKTITLSGSIISLTNSIIDCTNQINTFKGYLVGTEKILTVSDGSGDINYICTVNKNTVTRPNYLGYAKFTTTFLCSQPYGYATASSTLLNGTSRTSASYSDAITVGGNSEWQTPIITITLTAVAGGTGGHITISNSLTGQACTVTRNWAAGDVMIIDTSSITTPVTVNGTQVVFTGALPTFNPSNYLGGQTITYNDNFTSRTMTENVINYSRFD